MSKPQIHILIVEDDMVDRMACRRALAQNSNYEFILTETENGLDGLQAVQEKRPDCVLLDYNLPNLNGLEFLAALRTDMGETAVPVIMLTGADNSSVAVEAMKRGAQDYLVKDVNRQYLELLPAVIQRVLREQQALAEKKQMAARLVQAEENYRFLVEQIPAITYTAALDVPGKLLYVSPQLSMLGYSPEEWINQVGSMLSYVHPDDRTLAADVFDQVASANGKPLRCEFRLLNRSGEVRWFMDEASLVYDDEGLPLWLQGILIDITKDKLFEEELRQHRSYIEKMVAMRTSQIEKQAAVFNSANANLTARLSACTQASSALRKDIVRLDDLYQNAPCAYFLLDLEGQIVQINETGLDWLGSTREEVIGKMHLTDLLTPSDGKSFLKSFRDFKASGRLENLKLKVTGRDGRELSVSLVASAVRNDDGGIVMSCCMLFDTGTDA